MISIGGSAQPQYGTPYQNNSAFIPTTPFGGANGGDGSAAFDPSSLSGNGVSSNAFSTDSNGRPVVATLSDMQAATQPGDKLTIAGQVAEMIRMQSNACSGKRGEYHRVTEMTDQLKTLLDAMTSTVNGLTTTDDPALAGQADPAVMSHQSAMSKALERVALVMANLQVQASKAAPEVASQTKATLATVDKGAGTLAAQAGLNWSALSKAGVASLVSGMTTTTPQLINRLA